MQKVMIRLIDRSIIIGNVQFVDLQPIPNVDSEKNFPIDSKNTIQTIIISDPFTVTQTYDQSGAPAVVLLPMDLVFVDVTREGNYVTFTEKDIIWFKDLAQFPEYEKQYIQYTTGISMAGSGLIA